MLNLRDDFYKWLSEEGLSENKCKQAQKLIDGICKEITKKELQLIHHIVEEKDIDISRALSKYHFFQAIRKNLYVANDEAVYIQVGKSLQLIYH